MTIAYASDKNYAALTAISAVADEKRPLIVRIQNALGSGAKEKCT